MSCPAQRAIAAALRTVARHAGLTVSYLRGDEVLMGLAATPAAVATDLLIEEDLATRSLAQDWLVEIAALAPFGKPLSGDRIVTSAEDGSRTYEVCPLGGRSHYESVDGYGLQWRLHSKMIGGAA